MNNDLKIIKKKYGEAMMHLCRELFSTILDNQPGILSQVLLETFAPNHFLYDDLITSENCLQSFKDYIYCLCKKLQSTEENNQVVEVNPVTLMRHAGYRLYECQTEEDIQKFRKYYAKDEELCTFNGGRLNHCHVYFAVKDNADELRRDDFSHPERQDVYGTSVISIQFTRDDSHTLSIKNRYNHTVENPDATFSNNLDNIIPGLTQSFADYYGMKQQYEAIQITDLTNYVRASDGRFYKYNYEICNVYYCPGNIVIDNFQVTEYEKEKYLVMDYFILDLVNKKFVRQVHNPYQTSFVESISNIKKIKIKNEISGKTVTITTDEGKDIIIGLDKFNKIIFLHNPQVTVIHDDFLKFNRCLEKLVLDNVKTIGNDFLYYNSSLVTISLPNVLEVGDAFLANSSILELSLPKLTTVGHDFLFGNFVLKSLEIPEVDYIGEKFLTCNACLQEIFLPKLTHLPADFLKSNGELKRISFPKVETIDNFCLTAARNLKEIYLPEVKLIGDFFLHENQEIEELILPKVWIIGDYFMRMNENLKSVILPELTCMSSKSFEHSTKLEMFYAPKLSTNNIRNESLRNLCCESRDVELHKVYTLKTINRCKKITIT